MLSWYFTSVVLQHKITEPGTEINKYQIGAKVHRIRGCFMCGYTENVQISTGYELNTVLYVIFSLNAV